MKKVSEVIAAILLVLIVLIANKNRILSAFDTDYYMTTEDLNVRIGAGTDYSIFFTLQKGDEVEMLSRKDNWYKIRHLEKTGYAYSKYLKYSRTKSNTNYYLFQQIILYIVIGVFTGIILFVSFIIFRKIRDKRLLKTLRNQIEVHDPKGIWY